MMINKKQNTRIKEQWSKLNDQIHLRNVSVMHYPASLIWQQ
jgi:hypothetical protein